MTATAAEIRETIREMLTVWETLTPTQIAAALAASSAAADRAEAAFLASQLTWPEYLAAGRQAKACAACRDTGRMDARVDRCGACGYFRCATCAHYRSWGTCEAGDREVPAGAKDSACELHTTERPRDLIDDGYGIRASGGLVYFG